MPSYSPDCIFTLTLPDGSKKEFKGEEAFKQHLAENDLKPPKPIEEGSGSVGDAKGVTPSDFSKQMEEKHGITLDLMGDLNKKGALGDLTLSRIEVPKDKQGSGIGSKAMEDIVKYADENGKRIVLTPSTDFGATSVNRLKDFYKQFGFVENKGSNKDFTTKETMYREPIKNETTPTEVKQSPKQLADRIRSLKSDKGTLNVLPDLGLTKAIYDGALEFLASQVEKNTEFGKAIEATVNWVNENMSGKKWGEAMFRKHMEDQDQSLSKPAKFDIAKEDAKHVAELKKDDVENKVISGKTVSTRVPTSAGTDQSAVHKTGDNVANLKEARKSPSNYMTIAQTIASYDLMRRFTDPKDVKAIEKGLLPKSKGGSPELQAKGMEAADRVYKDFVRKVADNLLWLHDSVPDDVRKVSERWYDGANVLAQNLAKKYKMSNEQASAVLASLSPQMDWYKNISLAERVIDIVKTKSDFIIDQKIIDKYVELSGRGQVMKGESKEAFDARMQKQTEDAKKSAAGLLGKKLSEDRDYFPQMLRSYDEAYNSKSYNVYSPNGDIIGVAKNKPDKKGVAAYSKVGWQGYSTIDKAISLAQDGSPENISKQLGEEHKVRSFNNNISDPNSKTPHVTIDTHAVAAAFLEPLAGSDQKVKDNLSGKGSAETGISGTYAALSEAYDMAAKERGILARQMQSITWEAVRGLFKDTFKSDAKNKEAVSQIWKDYANHKINIHEARQRVNDAAGGIETPSWSRSSNKNAVEGKDSNKSGDVSEPGSVGSDRGTGRGNDKLGKAEVVRPAAKKLADQVRELKSKKGKLYDAGLGVPVAIWDGAIETIATAIELGESIVDAVKQGVQHIKDNHTGDPVTDKDIVAALHKELVDSGHLDDQQKKELTQYRVATAIGNLDKGKSVWQKIKDFVSKPKDMIKAGVKMFHAASFEGREMARDTMAAIRGIKGEENRKNEQADAEHHKLMNDWNSIPHQDKVNFILSIENPKMYGDATPEYKAMADMYRQRMDDVFDILSKIKDVPYTEDYFPHFWEKPDKAGAHFAAVHAKAPLEGNKSFLKQRFFADILSGLEAGYKLATDNPEEMVRLAETNAWKFEAAHKVFKEMKRDGLLKFFKTGGQPEGWQLVEDPLFKRMSSFVTEEGTAKSSSGGYYMPEPVAYVVNNYLSRGFAGKGVIMKNAFQSARAYNNVKNLFQLGFGMFHLTTTTMDATVTGAAEGVRLLTAGKPSGFGQLLSSLAVLPNIGKTLYVGDKGIKSYRQKGIMDESVRGMIDANARTGLSKIYTLDSYYNLKKGIGKLRADKDFSQLPGVVKNLVLTIPEIAAKPLMEWYVPRLKVGGMIRTAENEIIMKGGRGELSSKDIARIYQKAGDSMDDRLGQMVYDNLFWDKTMKDMAFLTIRSFGWTGGTIRAFGKGTLEAPESAKRLLKGEGLTSNTAWLLTLPAMVGTYGAMYQYIMTGKKPEEWRDYFFPKDGTKNADGTDHRVSLPSYMKDAFSYAKDPGKTLADKTSPIINEVISLFENKDFYGTEIYSGNLIEKGVDILKFEAESFIPFSFKPQSSSEKEPSLRQKVEQKFGIMPAKKEFQQTAIQNKISVAAQKSFKDEVKTKADAERISARRELRNDLFAGTKWKDIPKEVRDKARLTNNGQQAYIRDAKLNPYHRIFRDLPSEQQLKVWTEMKPEDKKEYKQ